ncbi:MAG: phosphotransferase [Anaerolineales bacterium]|jgi:Ser/Thr protein kinase RdoA (MazF antagonist)|nr:phosphotransferase [Anaerolineales bacterium]
MSATFDSLAAQALSAYGKPEAAFTFIQHSENVTFRVQDGPKTFLLRLHTPRAPEMGQHGSQAAMIRSELLWLDALKRARLPVPTAISNRAGERVTRLEWGQSPLNASLLTWLDGQDYTREFESEETAVQVGNLLGRLHKQASRWRLPAGFTRPTRGLDFFRAALENLRPAVDDGRIAYADLRQFEDALENLAFQLGHLRKTRQTWSLIHGDPYKGNFIYKDGQLAMIDFSLSAFSYPLFDLALALSDTREDLRLPLLAAYQEQMKLPFHWQPLLEGLYLASMVSTFSFWINSPQAQEELVRRVPLIAQEYATKYNYEERFWFAQNGDL